MPTIARYSLDGPVLPLLAATLPLAEAARRALMSRYRRVREFEQYGNDVPADVERFASAVFSGKDEHGAPTRGDHEHAFYLPTDEDGDGRIDHLTVFAQGGFPREEVRALDALRCLKCRDLELSLLLVGLGQQNEFRHSPVFGTSTTWISATPFLVTRHMKRRGQKRDPREFFETPDGRIEFVKQVLREELTRRGLLRSERDESEISRPSGPSVLGAPSSVLVPSGVEIEALESVGGQHRLRPIEFCLRRSFKPGDDGENRPRGLFRLQFSSPVSGPIALGHSCHFGLGIFLPKSSVGAAHRARPGTTADALGVGLATPPTERPQVSTTLPRQ